MDDASCDINHLDADVLLPPRKRLLAGLKKQSLDVGEGSSSPSLASCSSSSSPSSVFESRLSRLMSTHSNNPSLTLKEIAEASESAASTAADIAKAARAAAEEKAAIAVKKVAAAKSALDLVASFSEERFGDEGSPRRNKLKKQVPVHSLYRGRPRKATSSKTDEEVARRLHQSMNSSPRMVKSPPTPDAPGLKRKNPNTPRDALRNGPVDGVTVADPSRVLCNGHSSSGSGAGGREQEEIKAGDGRDKHYKKSTDGKPHADKDRAVDEKHAPPTGKKRGRVKLKKLPLSMCNGKDKADAKDEADDGIRDGDAGSRRKESPAAAAEANGKPPFWRCQELEAPPACGKRNKVSQ